MLLTTEPAACPLLKIINTATTFEYQEKKLNQPGNKRRDIVFNDIEMNE